MSKRRISEVFPEWDDGKGIFYYLSNLEGTEIPWVYGSEIDYDYIAHSGNKAVSPIVSRLLNDDGELTDTNAKKLASMLWRRFGVSWEKIYATLSLEYNPIENYSMTESGSDSGSLTGTDNRSINENRTDTGSRTGHSSQTSNTAGDTDVYGFNSVNSVPTDQVSGSNTGTGDTNENTTNQSGTIGTDNLSRSETTSGSHSLTRSGNIGVTTSQQMLQSERDLWMWTFFEMVYHDIDKVLTLRIY